MNTDADPAATPRWSRLRAALRCIARHLATDNGWLWAYGVGYPFPGPYALRRYSGRADDQQP